MSNISKEGAMNQVQMLVWAVNQALADDEARRNNPRKRKGGEASWAAATHYIAVLTGQDDWHGRADELAAFFAR